MKKNILLAICLTALVATAPVAVWAHHGTAASYDQKRVITERGVVTEFVWSNPHSQLYFDVTDDKGNVEHWGSEVHSPALLTARGWTRTCLKPGDEVIVIGNPSRIDAPVMELRSVKDLATGKVYYRELPGTVGEIKEAYQEPGN